MKCKFQSLTCNLEKKTFLGEMQIFQYVTVKTFKTRLQLISFFQNLSDTVNIILRDPFDSLDQVNGECSTNF